MAPTGINMGKSEIVNRRHQYPSKEAERNGEDGTLILRAEVPSASTSKSISFAVRILFHRALFLSAYAILLYRPLGFVDMLCVKSNPFSLTHVLTQSAAWRIDTSHASLAPCRYIVDLVNVELSGLDHN